MSSIPDPSFGLDEARAFIAACPFTYARTVPEHPHEYSLRAWLPPERQTDFDAFVALIARDGYSYTLEEVGHIFKVTRERIRQIEAKALRKLKHPSRSRKMRSFLDQ